jgi:hypothetical protein
LKQATITSKRKRAATTPLLDWRPCPPHEPVTRAGKHLCRRYRINPVIADLIASLAGLGIETEARQ